MANHSVNANEQATSVSTPVVAESGVPFVVGVAPVQSAENPATVGRPVLCTDWDEAVAKLGYSDDWSKYTICEAMYSHFKLYECQPIIFLNVLDTTSNTMTEAVTAADMDVSDHKIKLSIDALNDTNLAVKAAGGQGAALVKGTDYDTYYNGEYLVIELISTGSAYSATSLNVAYKKVKHSGITATTIATAVEKVELCLTKIGIVPDLILAPRYSEDPSVAAVMATKASNINGLFTAKALIDLDSSSSGATSYSDVLTKKNAANLTDKAEIVCWPKVKIGEKTFHMSTQLAGLIAKVDTDNSGVPYESPSNKSLKTDGLVLADGTEVDLTLAQANTVMNNGVVTAINFVNGWVAWGNYTACYPGNTDVKDYFVPISRSFGWVGNTLIKTFWSKLDNPMNRRLIDTILDTCNIWLNGLVGQGYFYGARVEMIESENPVSNLMAGIIKLHVYITPPAPAQEIDFVLEYDAEYVAEALS